MLIQPSRDTLIRHRFQHDSVFVLHEKTTQKGLTLTGSKSKQIRVDTVILKQTEYRYRQLHDTIRVSHTDTVPVVHVQEVIREVPSPIPRDKTLIPNGILRFYRNSTIGLFLCIVCTILYIAMRLYLRR